MFWDISCPTCEEVLNNVLPAVDHLQRPPERQGVPQLEIGDQVLVGRDAIDQRLKSEIERGLAYGGFDFLPEAMLEAALGFRGATLHFGAR